MPEKSEFHRPKFILSVFLILFMILSSGIMGVYITADPSLKSVYTMLSAAQVIDQNYPDAIDWDRLGESGRQAMFAELDRYSSFYPQTNFDRMDEEMGGSYTGIGISIVGNEEGLLVMSVRENGPADLAGIMSGDIITKADSVVINELSPSRAVTILRGNENSSVKITVLRPSSGKEFEVNVVRKKIELLHIPFAGLTEDSILYIRLLDFDPGASEALEKSLDSLIVNKPKGMILDLRENPGGLFSEAYNTANLFLNKGQFIVGTEGRSRWENKKYFATGEDLTDGIPMAVLVNHGSASAAEIVAGALQKAERAFLVGDTTFGKGLVQGFVRFPDGDGLKLTQSRYYLDGGVFFNEFDSNLVDTGLGLIPDYILDSDQPNFFKTELESSFVLRQFAFDFTDEILNNYENQSFDKQLIDNFIDYTEKEKIQISSLTTLLAMDVKFIAEYDDQNKSILEQVNNLISIAKDYDRSQYYDELPYIKNRLVQIAYEKKHGQYQTYKDVLLKRKPEIVRTIELLKTMEN